MDASNENTLRPAGVFRSVAGFYQIFTLLCRYFFAKRYGHRAIILETVAIPGGMVGGTLQHQALRGFSPIKVDHRLLDEGGKRAYAFDDVHRNCAAFAL